MAFLLPSKIEWLCRWNIMLLEYHVLWTA
jgi:hypothetical protein